MLSTTATTTVLDADPPTVAPLTAFGEDQQPAGVFTRPIDLALLEAMQIDELGRRAHWAPAVDLL